jgi:threonine-phosphate decarboxylase
MIDLRYSALPFPMPGEVRLELERELPALARYPDPAYAELKALLARDAGVGMENISIGNGADDLIDQLCKALPGPFRIPTPAFSEFGRAAKRNGKPVQFVPCLAGRRMDLEPLLAMGQRLKGSAVWLSNPNNPTGGGYEVRQLRALQLQPVVAAENDFAH